jgi:hypothetical protein
MTWLERIERLLELLGVYRTGQSSQAATDVKAGEEAALKAEQQRRASDAQIDADSNAADLEWLRKHGTSAGSSGDKPG